MLDKLLDKYYQRKMKKENRKLNIIKWGVELYFLEGLQRLIEEDLWNYLDSINPDYYKKKLVNIISECSSDCLNIYLDFPQSELGDYENREIAHIHSEDTIFVLKKYNNRSRIYKRRLKNYIKELEG